MGKGAAGERRGRQGRVAGGERWRGGEEWRGVGMAGKGALTSILWSRVNAVYRPAGLGGGGGAVVGSMLQPSAQAGPGGSTADGT